MLILPDEVFDTYSEYNEKDPYAYAMSMIGVDINAVDENGNNKYEQYVNSYITNLEDSERGNALKNLKEKIKTLYENEIFPYMKDNEKKNDYEKETDLKELKN